MTTPARANLVLRLVRGGAAPAAKEPRDADLPPGEREAPFDDSQLLSAVRAGDRVAAGAFYDRVVPRIDRTIRRLLGASDPDREDLTQATLIELVSTIDRYRGDCSLDAWVTTVTAHVVYKKIRRRTLERRAFAQGLDEQDEDSAVFAFTATPADDVAARDLLARVQSHLDAMSADRAWAFVLHDVWGYDLRETARIMEVSVAAAQSRLVRGRRELHARIADDPELARSMLREEGES